AQRNIDWAVRKSRYRWRLTRWLFGGPADDIRSTHSSATSGVHSSLTPQPAHRLPAAVDPASIKPGYREDVLLGVRWRWNWGYSTPYDWRPFDLEPYCAQPGCDLKMRLDVAPQSVRFRCVSGHCPGVTVPGDHQDMFLLLKSKIE